MILLSSRHCIAKSDEALNSSQVLFEFEKSLVFLECNFKANDLMKRRPTSGIPLRSFFNQRK